LALANGGCLLVAAGAAGGAAVGYAYYKGKASGQYNASLADTWNAAHAALRELGMPMLSEETGKGTGFIESRTAEGEQVRLYLETEQSKIPAEGEVTRLCVRVGTFGDWAVSERILNQVGMHLVPLGSPVPTSTTQPNAAAQGVIQTGAFTPTPAVPPPAAAPPTQTPPPPLLPPEPAPVMK
jgi:hypothetical protein